jgi:membrane dipeptidase
MRVIAGIVLMASVVLGQQREVTDAEVSEVHRSALLIDTHNDVTSRTLAGFDIGQGSDKGHTDVPRLREGGVGAVFFAAYVAPAYAKNNTAANRALQMIDTIRYDIVARHPGDFVLALTADDVATAHTRGKIAALIGSKAVMRSRTARACCVIFTRWAFATLHLPTPTPTAGRILRGT